MRSRLAAVVWSLALAACFGGVGVLTAWLAATMMHDGVRARHWVPVEARVVGEDTYRYAWQGRDYESDRITLLRMGESDVDGSKEVLARLAHARAVGRPIQVWVNPADPAEAVAERAIPWLFVVAMSPFVLGFGGVGIAALWSAARHARTIVQPWRLSESFPGSAAFGGGRQWTLATTWVAAAFWNLIALPVGALALADLLAGGDKVALAVLLFPLIGLFLLWSALAQTWQAIRRWRATPEVSPAGKVL